MAYQIVVIPMTMSYLQGHAPNEGLLKRNFLYICAAADKISTNSTLLSTL